MFRLSDWPLVSTIFTTISSFLYLESRVLRSYIVLEYPLSLIMASLELTIQARQCIIQRRKTQWLYLWHCVLHKVKILVEPFKIFVLQKQNDILLF